MANPRALIVDDEPDLCELLSLTLARMGVDSSAVHDLASARRELQARRDYALCLTDLRLPDGDGTELIEWIQRETPELPVAVMPNKTEPASDGEYRQRSRNRGSRYATTSPVSEPTTRLSLVTTIGRKSCATSAA